MELSYRDIKKKDVINVVDGSCLGNVIDMVFTFPKGQIAGIVVPGSKCHKIFRFLNRSELYIDKRKIVLKESIKAYGKYSVELKVHPEVIAKFIVHVHD